jgi:hypothetical protein
VEHRRRRPDQARNSADDLIRRLRDRFAPGGLLHYGQGKWYPGESLPRWAFSLYWRKDGQPIWSANRLIAGETAPDRRIAAPDRRRRRWPALRRKLGLDPDHVQPAYEDPALLGRKEGALPDNVDAEGFETGRAEERAALARVFERGLRQAARLRPADPALEQGRGDGLALARSLDLRAASCSWCRATRRSATACRSAACRSAARDYPHIHPGARPFEPRDRPAGLRQGRRHAAAGAEAISGLFTAEDPRRRAHRASSRAARRGAVRLHAAGREGRGLSRTDRRRRGPAAAELGLPSISRAIRRRSDPRINVIKVTPDPGVIEVNIHPASNWREAVEITTTASMRRRARRGSAPTSS